MQRVHKREGRRTNGEKHLRIFRTRQENSHSGYLSAALWLQLAWSLETWKWDHLKLIHYERTDGLHTSQGNSNLTTHKLVGFLKLSWCEEETGKCLTRTVSYNVLATYSSNEHLLCSSREPTAFCYSKIWFKKLIESQGSSAFIKFQPE